MAITAPHYRILRELQPLFPHRGSLLEIGEANWYGDVEPDFPCPKDADAFAIAKAFYATLFAPSRVVSIDFDGTPAALRHDLNAPLPFDDQFDVVWNHGTAEHVFNIAQVFATMHDRCAPGGLMLHDAPFTGWIEHGFYNMNPTLFYDLAAANGYELVRAYVTAIEGCHVQRLESREHVYDLAGAAERWAAVSTGDKHAVIRHSNGGPPAMSQLEGKTDAPCTDWVRVWCPTFDLAKEIAAQHNATSRIPNNAMLFVMLRKLGDGAFKVPIQGYYAQTLSAAGAKAWRELR